MCSRICSDMEGNQAKIPNELDKKITLLHAVHLLAMPLEKSMKNCFKREHLLRRYNCEMWLRIKYPSSGHGKREV